MPFVLFALIVHQIERFIQIRLAERFGWKSVLITGWLGTPIHELSHAFFCLVFRHRIDEIQLFEPDLKSGRLGYVHHSYHKNNQFQRVGNVFIGMAPLIGGAIALIGLLLIFYPNAAMQAIEALREQSENQSIWQATANSTWGVLVEIFQVSNLATARFWVFSYLILCVGNHMAPSRSDYEGAARGGVLLSVFVFVVVFLISLFSNNSESLLPSALEILTPVFAVLILAVILCSIGAALTFLITIPFQKKYHIQLG